ncbi:MAG: FadR family transcriptional regulator [Firmicutes bacterium]|nr:FadR family transcriptional regulator [Bacillota bacterium]
MFKPVKTRKVYEEIVGQIRELIANGTLRPGDRLISERELADKLRVSRASVREAFSVLESLGIIESRPGEGTFIREETADSIAEPLALLVVRERDSGFALLEVRKILEVEAAGLAAARATPEDIQKIDDCLLEMKTEVDRGELGDVSDYRFHYALAEAAQNSVLVRVMATISDLFAQGLRSSRLRLYSLDGMPQILMQQHSRISDSVRGREPAAARQAMREHLEFVEQKLRELEGER